jgi:hypothetical protein
MIFKYVSSPKLNRRLTVVWQAVISNLFATDGPDVNVDISVVGM